MVGSAAGCWRSCSRRSTRARSAGLSTSIAASAKGRVTARDATAEPVGSPLHRLIQRQAAEQIAEQQLRSEGADDPPGLLALGLDPAPEGDGCPGARRLEQEEVGTGIGAALEPPIGAPGLGHEALDGRALDHADDEIGVVGGSGQIDEALDDLRRQQRVIGGGDEQRARQSVDGGHDREARRRLGHDRLDAQLCRRLGARDADDDASDRGRRAKRVHDPCQHRLAGHRQQGLERDAGGPRHRVAFGPLAGEHEGGERRPGHSARAMSDRFLVDPVGLVGDGTHGCDHVLDGFIVLQHPAQLALAHPRPAW